MHDFPFIPRRLHAHLKPARWFFLVGFFLLFSASGLRAETAHARWFSGPFEYAVQAAKLQKKLVFLDMYADWCYPCKRMEREVFSQPHVSQYLQKHFVSVKRNGMHGEGRQIAKRYNCVTYPCMLVINEKGREIGRLTRFTAATPFVQRLRELRQNKNTLDDLLPQLQRRPRDAVLHFRIGFRYAYRGDKRCIRHLQFAAQHPDSQYPHLAAKALYVLGRIYYRNTLRDCASANQAFREYMKRFPTGVDIRRVQGLYKRCLRSLRR